MTNLDKLRTFGALQAADKTLSLMDLRRSSGNGTLGIKAEVAEIIDRETGLTELVEVLDDAEHIIGEFIRCPGDADGEDRETYANIQAVLAKHKPL